MEKRNWCPFRRTLLVTILALCSCMGTWAQANKSISVDFKNKPATEAMREIQQRSGARIQFNASDLNFNVTHKAKNESAINIVKSITAAHKLVVFVRNNDIIIRNAGNQKQGIAIGVVLQGKVVDENGDPLIGATLRMKGTNDATLTNNEGDYTFPVTQTTGEIEISYIGFEPITLPLSSLAATKVIKMHPDQSQTLDNVVVTGIFRKSRESYTGAVSTIGEEQLQMYKSSNLLNTLKNIDASINFPLNNLDGSNPNVLPNLNIRGTSSLPMSVEEFNQNVQQTVNTPLIIMDGFEISLTKLMDYNDEQIESINILKDAAATAIYGSRGANGVIVIVSKNPKEGRLRVTAKAGLSLELPDLSSYHLLNAEQKLQLEKLAGLYTNRYNPQTQVQLDQYYQERLKAVEEGTDIDWMSKPLRNGIGQRYNIQLDGGSNDFRWGASLGYNGIEGAMKGSSRRTITGDITLMYSMKNLIFRNYTSIAQNHAKESPYGSFQNYVDMEPYDAPYDENGRLVSTFYNYNHSSLIGNPLYNATLNTINQSEYLEVVNNFSIEWIILDGLRMRAKLGVLTHRNSSDYFLPAEHTNFDTYTSAEDVIRKGSYTYGTGRNSSLTGNVTLSYNKIFAEKHQLYFGADYSIQEQKRYSYSFESEGYSNEDLNTPGNALQYKKNAAPSSAETTVRMIGITGNFNYTYDNRYYVDLSYRTDGSSKFGSDKRFAPFWSTGIGWNLHNEAFLKGNKVVNTLRLKGSYGITGSQDFTTESVFTTYQYAGSNRYVGWSAARMMGLGNSRLTWQKTKETNFGLEFGVLQNRISGQFDYYTKRTSNLLSYMELPLSMGFSSYTANVGELKNYGFEASLNAYIIRDYTHKLNWMVGGQLVYNKNKITKLSDAIKQQNELYLAQNVDVSNLFYEGRPMNAIYAVRSKGIDPQG